MWPLGKKWVSFYFSAVGREEKGREKGGDRVVLTA